MHTLQPPQSSPPTPRPSRPSYARPASARSATRATKSVATDQPWLRAHLGHPFLREPDWRGGNIRGPGWDGRKAIPIIPSFSPLHFQSNAMIGRIERGGPLLGRSVGPTELTPEPLPQQAAQKRMIARPASARPARTRATWNASTKTAFYVDPPAIFVTTLAQPVRLPGHFAQNAPAAADALPRSKPRSPTVNEKSPEDLYRSVKDPAWTRGPRRTRRHLSAPSDDGVLDCLMYEAFD